MSENLSQKAREIAFLYIKRWIEDGTPEVPFNEEDVNLVWFSKTLKNWKALVSTPVLHGMYFELTHDGEKYRTYIDAYKKVDNRAFDDQLDVISPR